jgi:PAS domain S-box-containing protein
MPNNDSPSLQTRHDKTLVELENYKLLVENVKDYAIFLLDINGNIRTWNKGAQKIKGYAPEEIIGKHFSTFYLQDDIDAKKPERELVIARKVGRVEDEDWRVRKDGSRFWANVVITALFSNSGKLVGYAKVTRDLSERKQQEDDLRRANVLLRKQQQELKALNESKDEFISLASHQLRTPATGIKQLLGLLLEGFEGELPARLHMLIQKAYEANDRQISIVNSLLQVAQLDAGKVALRKSAIDAGTLLQEVVDEQADTIANRHQTIRYLLPPKPIYTHGDQKYLRMALENIVDNASKYTYENGKITVKISIKNNEVLISVADTGVGIPQEHLPDLFQKFKRIPNELSQKVSGSGLGLYWVRKVIELHGGRIDASSAHKKGTTVLIRLPQGED